MKYSFLVPVFNVERNLKECIESLLLQKVISDYEILLYDDCSTDSSGQICDTYRKNHADKIKVIHGKENIGALRSRLELIKKALGDVIIFVDSDDYVSDEILLTIDNAFCRYKCDLIIFEHWAHYDLISQKFYNRHISVFDATYFYEGDKKSQLYNIFTRGKINSIWRKAFKKDLFSFPYDDNIRDTVTVGEDVLLSLPIITEAKKILCLNIPLYYYRCSQNGITRSDNAEKLIHKIKNAHEFYWQLNLFVEKWKVNEVILYDTICRAVCAYLDSILLIKGYNNRKILYMEILKSNLFYKALNQNDNNNRALQYLKMRDYRKMEWHLLPRKVIRIIRKLIFQLFIR